MNAPLGCRRREVMTKPRRNLHDVGPWWAHWLTAIAIGFILLGTYWIMLPWVITAMMARQWL